MDLKLEKPIVFFDLETTGTNVAKDRIVEIALLKVNPDQTEESFCTKVNPEIPIPKETSEIHGIYDKDITDSPKLQDIADKIIDFIGNADLAGYNSNKFDVPLLVEQLVRVGKKFDLKD